jgi:hypothetical protein
LKVQIIIPIYRPDDKFLELLRMIKKQTLKNIPTLLIDSGKGVSYTDEIQGMNLQVRTIDSSNFNHGGTRQWGMELYPEADIYVFLTQDAILADEHSIENLITVFDNGDVGCAYGRQLPHKNATFFSAFARGLNYPAESHVLSYEDRERYGMKTVFISNSFAAYRREAMAEVGGFPTNTILSEDMFAAANMVLQGWKIAYVSEACVYHSHNYTVLQEFKRYFDIGVFHSRESWIRTKFGAAESSGIKYIVAEIKAAIKENPFLLLELVLRDGFKFLGYRMGLNEKRIPLCLKRYISMTSKYW